MAEVDEARTAKIKELARLDRLVFVKRNFEVYNSIKQVFNHQVVNGWKEINVEDVK